MRSVKYAAFAAALLMLCAAASGCGEKNEDLPAAVSTPTSAETTAVSETTVSITQSPAETEASSAAENAGHPVLSELAADRIIASLYTEEERGGSKEYKEMLFTLFSDEKGTPCCALITFSKSRRSSTILCGKYTAETSEDAAGTLWTNIDITDAVTGEEHKIGFAEGEDLHGNYIGYILDENGGDHRAKPISAADTADRIAEALACENAVEEEDAPETESEEAEETTEEQTTTVTEETTETETTTVSETTTEETTTTVSETTAETVTTTLPETTTQETTAAVPETASEETSEVPEDTEAENSSDGSDTEASAENGDEGDAAEESAEETTAKKGAGHALTVRIFSQL